jgi:hypothetical protein
VIGDFILPDKMARAVGNIPREMSVYTLNEEIFEAHCPLEESVWKRDLEGPKQVIRSGRQICLKSLRG